MNPLKILFASDVSAYEVVGGAERVLREQTVRLARRGHQVHVLARESGGRQVRHQTIDGVRISSFPVDSSRTLRIALASIWRPRALFRDLQRRVGFDLLNLHQPFSGLGLLTAPESRGIPVLYTFFSPAFQELRTHRGSTRGLIPLYAAVLARLERFCLSRAQRIVVLSQYTQSQLREQHGVARERTVVVGGGVDLERFSPSPVAREALKRELGCSPDVPLLLTVRNLVPRMGLDHLLRALKELAGQVELLLVIGGDGHLVHELKALAAQLGLAPVIRFEGFIPEDRLPLYYQAADFFVLPTQALEGFGLVTVEALACGTPVLGTPVGATPEILRALQADLVFDGTDSEAIARGIRAHLARRRADPPGYQFLRGRCRAHAVTHFDWESKIERLEQQMVELAGRGARRLG